jgi:hypothetical protein
MSMVEGSATTTAWRIEYTDLSAQGLAESLGTALGDAGRPACPTSHVRPAQGTYGTPEIIITILATSLSKAVLLWGLDALEKRLSERPERGGENLRIVVDSGSAGKEQFPLSLRDLSREFVTQFVGEIKDYVGKL